MRLNKDTSIPAIVRMILAKQVTLKMLSRDQRLESISYLTLEGIKQITIAELLSCDPKTIRRYIAEIRQQNRAMYNEEEIFEKIGEYNMIIDHETKRLMHIAATTTDLSHKIKAAMGVNKSLIQKMQMDMRMGYLPPNCFELKEKLAPPSSPANQRDENMEIEWKKAYEQMEEFIKAYWHFAKPSEFDEIRRVIARVAKEQKEKKDKELFEATQEEIRRRMAAEAKAKRKGQNEEPEYFI